MISLSEDLPWQLIGSYGIIEFLETGGKFSGFKTSRRPPEFHRLLDCMSPATLDPPKLQRRALRPLNCHSRLLFQITVGRLLQNILKALYINQFYIHISDMAIMSIFIFGHSNERTIFWKNNLVNVYIDFVLLCVGWFSLTSSLSQSIRSKI